jgi:hypothetical protein
VVDFDRLSSAQLAALGNVAFGGYGAGCNKKTLDSLVSKGLIERVGERRADRFGTFTVYKWTMPIPVHVEFCEWCANRVNAEESADDRR